MAAFLANRPSRRGFLHVGMLGTAGPGLATLLRLQHASATENSAAAPARQPSVIILWMRRSQPARNLGPQTRNAGGVPRLLWFHFHVSSRNSNLRHAATLRKMHGQVVNYPQPAPQRCWSFIR
ncbi:MAG UNVERIFIED_CONTAM: hypothetical protein LVR18_39520 [Planctomycetaceae bacterium]